MDHNERFSLLESGVRNFSMNSISSMSPGMNDMNRVHSSFSPILPTTTRTPPGLGFNPIRSTGSSQNIVVGNFSYHPANGTYQSLGVDSSQSSQNIGGDLTSHVETTECIEVDSPQKHASKSKEKGKGNKKKEGTRKCTPNKKWSSKHDDVLIPFLVDQASKGLKCDKTFKTPAFSAAAREVNRRFGTDYDAKNVENHMRTIKDKWKEICECKNISGAGWDDDQKIITLDTLTFEKYVEAHPGRRQYLNVPIPYYEELKIICGEDQADGSFKRSIYQSLNGLFRNTIQVEDDQPSQMTSESAPIEVDKSLTPPKQSIAAKVTRQEAPSATRKTYRTSNKKPKIDATPEFYENLCGGLDKIANAIIATHQVDWLERLSSIVLKMEGFDLMDLNRAFNVLYRNKLDAKAFIVKPPVIQRAEIKSIIDKLGSYSQAQVKHDQCGGGNGNDGCDQDDEEAFNLDSE